MALVRRHPDGMACRHHPQTGVGAHGEDAPRRAEELTFGMTVRRRHAGRALDAGDGDEGPGIAAQAGEGVGEGGHGWTAVWDVQFAADGPPRGA
jgi:hypothetical protein